MDACSDELEVLFECKMQNSGCGIENILKIIRERVIAIFGPRDADCQDIRISHFVEETVRNLRSCFAHRQIDFRTRIPDAQAMISIHPEVLTKITEGLIRNAVENTPDQSRIKVSVFIGGEGPELEIGDFGTGIT